MNLTSTKSYLPRTLPLRLPRVCVALVGADAAAMVEKAESVVRDDAFLEFRLDYLKNPASAGPRIRKFLDTRPDATVIATCRRVQNGGKFKGSLAAQLDVLLKAAAAGCQIVDIELEMVQERIQTATGTKAFCMNVTASAREYLLAEGTDSRYGARHLKRAIERLLVQPLSNLMASGQIERGDTIRVSHRQGSSSLVFFYEVPAFASWNVAA